MNKLIDIHDEEHNILSLLPYSVCAQLISKNQKLADLYFMKSIIDFSINALELFLAGKLMLFDAQVGENLCQIRAYKILNLAQKWLCSPIPKNQFSQEIELFRKHKEHLEHIIFEWENTIKHSKTYNKSLDSKENIGDFFARQKLLIPLQDDFIFIIVCYFLSHFNIRENQIPVAINLEYISREFHISKYRSKRLTHKYQQLICTLGCNFIIKIAHELPERYGFVNMLPTLYKTADEDRAVLPCYTVSEIILYHSIKEQLPILFVTHQLTEQKKHLQPHKVIYFLLAKTQNNNEFSLVPTKNFLLDYCMVVSGEVHYKENSSIESPQEYINRVLWQTPLKLILANTASHPQYSGKKLEALRDNPFQCMELGHDVENIKMHEHNLINMQQFALTSGCTKQNPSLFFLRHIYSSSIQEEISQLEKNYTGPVLEAYQVINS
ncbi:hypothetical protein [Legionella fallonii]|uniref:Uncharacterized protein n=1 Tax=Legionella fallonii LLAP-10 TaxID=1212491 RepID=A0A098G6A2_9GAMM|nr:hypothetical protein [Legionella fallonii]CEG57506.1 protein of unknown function [Legionella fallonii LLAP-10]